MRKSLPEVRPEKKRTNGGLSSRGTETLIRGIFGRRRDKKIQMRDAHPQNHQYKQEGTRPGTGIIREENGLGKNRDCI